MILIISEAEKSINVLIGHLHIFFKEIYSNNVPIFKLNSLSFY
jgi:hypothetical protein